MAEHRLLRRRDARGRLWLTLNRPQIHNAFDDALLAELAVAVEEAGADPAVRLVVLAGEGRSFCAGADLAWMRAMVDASLEESRADAARVFSLLEAIATCPRPVVAKVHGAALGGGMGLVAACDLVAAAPGTRFGLTEVRLGLVPAMIFPFLLRKVQRHHLLEAALTGERFDAARALAMGLVNVVTDDLDGAVDRWTDQLGRSGPAAVGSVKELFQRVPGMAWEEARAYTTEMIARVRRGEEGQEGMRAFLERRRPAWAEDGARDEGS